MSQREIEMAVFHEEMIAERVRMIARVKRSMSDSETAKREGKRHTLSIKSARAFKYQVQGR